MEETSRRGIWSTSILRFGKDWHSLKLYQMQWSFKEHFQPIAFQKLFDWRLEISFEKACMSPRPPTWDLTTSRLDKGIGFENWSTTATRSCSTTKRRNCPRNKILPTNQTNPKTNLCVIDQGILKTNTKCLFVKREKSWSQEIKESSSHEELCSSDRSRQPDKHAIAQRTTPEIHCEIKTLNIDNEKTLERIKNPGLPHSTVKQLQSASVWELIQKIENHPNRHAL